ncbi:hypothetical protein ACFXKD_00655 [Nocardiopsis aegyptia]|uniref:hypothetical protein n=1 Tax=Nocardiopsis aegyptia TaxID=220378 RepID=UPI003671A0D1
MEDLQTLYTEAARATEEEWVRELAGVDGPVTREEREQALGALFDQWAQALDPGA